MYHSFRGKTYREIEKSRNRVCTYSRSLWLSVCAVTDSSRMIWFVASRVRRAAWLEALERATGLVRSSHHVILLTFSSSRHVACSSALVVASSLSRQSVSLVQRSVLFIISSSRHSIVSSLVTATSLLPHPFDHHSFFRVPLPFPNLTGEGNLHSMGLSVLLHQLSF